MNLHLQFLITVYLFQVIDATNSCDEGSNSDEDEVSGSEIASANESNESYFVSTRSGRIAGNWRLASYIGK